jgi:molecular chaperone HtpG
MTDVAGEERFEFQAEVGRLLDIVARSLYSDKSVFLRELISNAADACDKLRYLALTEPTLIADDPEFRIRIVADKAARTLTIEDNGIGMGREELIENLGTIARSGTAAFAADGKEGAPALIGQFGVGFYAAFMVAERVEVVTRRAGTGSGDAGGWRWASVGQGEFSLNPEPRAARGTSVILHLAAGEDEFLDPAGLKSIVEKYSNHIGVPIELGDGSGDTTTINAGSALWLKPRTEIAEDEYAEFYRHHGHAFDAPWLTMHFRAEGVISYAGLLFVPTERPFDLFNTDRRQCVKLFVRRVFITDDCALLLPPWLRFVRGMVDSEDLPLNISREMLQSNAVVAKIRNGLVKRILGDLGKKAKDAPEEYARFWDAFGAVMKEGLYEEPAERERILPLVRVRTTASDGLVSLDEYVARMKDGQDAIYYITGDTLDVASKSPQLEGFRARGIEVLLLTDAVDEFWVPTIGRFADKPFRSVTQGAADLDAIAAPEKKKSDAEATVDAGQLDGLVAWLKLTLDDAVKDVRTTGRLTDSPACLVAGDGALDMRLERILRAHKQLEVESKRILEINPDHPLIAVLAASLKRGARAELDDAAFLLLDQARLAQGEEPADPAAFAKRMTSVMVKALG